ncbi:hypothetical protein VA249_45250 (plasmid) [Vibrio alfacsensis]|uniref:hypothetical protein n=1 Tax=Vibrio alfacsensis TaxID=1074311 RepID=UPI001BEE5051|nr:hypothetical protein [Vibrio alfacsensis]BBM67879.1 hypothetical protein VA249_45250 [Vibrio alfacsensis]
MLTNKQKFLLEQLLPYSFVGIRTDKEFDHTTIEQGYIEVRNGQEQSFRFDITTVEQHPSESDIFVASLVADLKSLEANHRSCNFDLDPLSIGLDSSIIGELWVDKPINVEIVALIIPIPALPPLRLDLTICGKNHSIITHDGMTFDDFHKDDDDENRVFVAICESCQKKLNSSSSIHLDGEVLLDDIVCSVKLCNNKSTTIDGQPKIYDAWFVQQ